MRARSALAFALMLWCAGAGCMIVAYAHGGVMSGMSASKVGGGGWDDVSASIGTHSCCKARHSSERRVAQPISDRASSAEPAAKFETITLAEVPQSSDAMSCCPLTGGTFVVASRQRISNQDASEPKGIDSITVLPGSQVAASRSYALDLPFQSQTHVRLCVFLI
jgi:hypothetical protein